MATHDYDLANQSGAAFRTDLNNALSAIATNNSNSSDPSTTFASQYFADTSNSLMKLRNTSNNAFVNLFTLAGGPAFSVDGTINSVNVGKGANSVAGNTVLGEGALDASVSGANNTAIGKDVLTANTSGANNTAVGKDAMKVNTSGVQNVAVGAFALDANSSGGSNTALGYAALDNNTTASNNTAVGNVALTANTTGTQNNGIGVNALTANQTGDFNTAVGTNALSSNTTADNNTAIGRNALLTCTTGEDNTSVGSLSLDALQTGGQNVAVGVNALTTLTTGNNNAALGRGAGTGVTTGSQNTYLGDNAATSHQTGANCIYMGHACNASSTSVDEEIVLGVGLTGKGTNTTFVAGTNGVFNEANGTAWSTTSDQRIKKNIVNYDTGLSIINQLQVRNFEYKTEDEIKTDNPELTDVLKSAVINITGTQTGLVAQEAEAVLASSVKTESTGVKTLCTDDIFWHMLNAIKELSTKVTALEAG